MLAGFLGEVERQAVNLRLTCCTPHPLAPMRLRFPQVEWSPYDSATRERSIAECDVWLGLGDTPFQTVLGDWMLDHLLQEAAWCQRHGKRMYYLAVGGDADNLALHPKVRVLASRAAHIWTRDRTSAALLRVCAPETRVDSAADLAHLWLAAAEFPRTAPDVIGLVLNFEQPEQATAAQLDRLVMALFEGHVLHWLAQEVRPLDGSEVALHHQLSEDAQRAAPLTVPDYAGAPNVSALLASWGAIGGLLTSRYHAALIAAWAGWRTVVYPRSAKVRSAACELGLPTVPGFADTKLITARLADASPAPRHALEKSLRLAREACAELFSTVCA